MAAFAAVWLAAARLTFGHGAFTNSGGRRLSIAIIAAAITNTGRLDRVMFEAVFRWCKRMDEISTIGSAGDIDLMMPPPCTDHG
jgi:hypothetical protein